MRNSFKSAKLLVITLMAVCVVFGCQNESVINLDWAKGEVAAVEKKIDGIDWASLVAGTVKGLEGFQRAAKIGIYLPCQFGLLGKDACEAYAEADKEASEILPNADAAIAAYKADPAAGNEQILKDLYGAAIAAWNGYQEVNDKAPYIGPDGNPLGMSTVQPGS